MFLHDLCGVAPASGYSPAARVAENNFANLLHKIFESLYDDGPGQCRVSCVGGLGRGYQCTSTIKIEPPSWGWVRVRAVSGAPSRPRWSIGSSCSRWDGETPCFACERT